MTRYTVTADDETAGSGNKAFFELPSNYYGNSGYVGYKFDTPNGTSTNYLVTPVSGMDSTDVIITSPSAADTIYGGLGNDTLEGGGHNDLTFGGSGDDYVSAGSDNDLIYGDYADLPTIVSSTDWQTPSEDTSLTGNDIIYAGNGSDTVYGGPGDDQIDAGPRGNNDTDVVEGGDGSDSFMLSYDSGSSSSTSDIWGTYVQNYIDFGAYDECQEILGKLAEDEVAEIIGEMGSTVLLTGVGAALGTLASTLDDWIFAMLKSSKPKTNEDVLVIKDFNPSEDVIYLPLESGVTLTEEVAYFTSAAVSGVSGWGIKFNDGVSGTTYAEVFLDSSYLEALGIADSSSTYTIDAIQSLLATSVTITSSGVSNSDDVYALGEDSEVSLLAASGTDIVAFGAFGPLSIVNPSGSGKIVIGGTVMGDIMTVNDQLVVPSQFEETAAYASTDRSYIRGFDGDDILYGGAGPDEIYGDDGDDQIYGFVTTDTTEGPETELLYGGNGNDLLAISTGAASLDGGNGTDTASHLYADAAVTVDLGAGTGYDRLGSAASPNYTYVDIESLIGSNDDDTLTASDDGNGIDGADGDDTVFGGSGGDTLVGGNGGDTLAGEGGTDTVSYADATDAITVDLGAGTASDGDTLSDIEVVIGTSLADTLTGRGLGSTLEGGNGGDTLTGGDGVDFAGYYTASAAVTVYLDGAGTNTGDAAGDTFDGIEGIAGSTYGDSLYGDSGDNSILGDAGNDSLYGGNGDDRIMAGGGTDTVDGGDGIDTLDYSTGTKGTLIDFASGIGWGNGNDALSDVENAIGTEFSDTIIGANGNDTFWGGAGNDILIAEENNWGTSYDALFYGGDGNDTYDGGNGTDTAVIGGTYADYSFEVSGSELIATSSAGNVETIAWETVEYVEFDDGLYSITSVDSTDTIQLAAAAAGPTIVLVAATTAGAVTELGEGNRQENRFVHSAFGRADPDPALGADAEVTAVSPDAERYRGSLAAEIDAAGRLRWTYHVEDVELDRLRPGRTIEQSYSVTIEDGSGHTVVETVTVTLTGKSDTAGRSVTDGDDGNGVAGTQGDDAMLGGGGNDRVDAGWGSDFADGGNGNDTVVGERGDDTIAGGAGDDTVYGGNGDDVILGGTGDDVQQGGWGDDRFVFLAGDGNDRITQFVRGEDVIDFAGYAGGGSAALTFADLTLTPAGTAVVVKVGDLQITVEGVTALSEDDFLF
ncbi:MAG: calcium-binding protein [Geminicoccaceae bacterium]